jgi:hypothetical protein
VQPVRIAQCTVRASVWKLTTHRISGTVHLGSMEKRRRHYWPPHVGSALFVREDVPSGRTEATTNQDRFDQVQRRAKIWCCQIGTDRPQLANAPFLAPRCRRPDRRPGQFLANKLLPSERLLRTSTS